MGVVIMVGGVRTLYACCVRAAHQVLAHERRRLAGEHDQEEAEGIEPRQERSDQRSREEDVAVPAAGHRGGDDRVLREEAGERRDAHERQRADQERDPRHRHQPADAAHLADVLFAGERMDHEPGRQE